MPLEVFYSYAHEDEALRDEVEKHLSLLKRNGLIVGWHDRGIGAGDEWRDQIDAHARSAHIILLLISPDFLASDYCYDVEMKLALERHARREARVVPIILRPVDWLGAPFSHLQALPRDGKAVTTWPNRDEAFANIAQGIRAIVSGFRAGQPDTIGLTPPVPKNVPKPRVLDAAVPSHIVKGQPTELQVLIRLPESRGLKGILLEDEAAEARPEDVLSKDFKVTFPLGPDGSPEALKVSVRLTSPDFDPPAQTKVFLVPPDEDSELVSFLLTPLRAGKLKVLVELQWEEALRGSRRLLTECVAEAASLPQIQTHVVRMPLEVAPGPVFYPSLLDTARRYQQTDDGLTEMSGYLERLDALRQEQSRSTGQRKEQHEKEHRLDVPQSPPLPAPMPPPAAERPQEPRKVREFTQPAMPPFAKFPPPPAPKPNVEPPKATVSYWPLVLVLTVLLFMAVLLVLYFVLKR